MENAVRRLEIKGKKTKQNHTDLKTRRENQGRPEPYSGRTQPPPGMGPWEGERKQVQEDHPPVVHPPPVQKPGLALRNMAQRNSGKNSHRQATYDRTKRPAQAP